MRWQQIYDTLQNYEEEYRKGWYSYTWANGSVTIARKSDPETQYVVWKDRSVVGEQLAKSENSDGYYWNSVMSMDVDDLPDADDYYIASDVSHPFIAMVVIKEDMAEGSESLVFKNGEVKTSQEIREVKRNQKVLNHIKNIVRKYDDLFYKIRNGFVSESEKPAGLTNCAYCGIGDNEYTEAEFYLNDQDMFICTNGSIARENKQRRHFGEREWLFPWKSNGFDKDHVLYVRISCLKVYKGDALFEEKNKALKNLDFLLSEVGICNYEVIEITRPYKYTDN